MCIPSNFFCGTISSKERREAILDTFQRVLDEWRISRAEASVLYSVFDGADLTRDGYINAIEFFRALNYRESPFTRRIYGLFDANANSEVDFGEFVTMAWSYMSPSPYSLVMLGFALFDDDDSGDVSAEEVAQVVRELYNDPNFDRALIADLNIDGVSVGGPKRKMLITRERFSQFAVKYPAILYPALRVQESFRHTIGGVQFWRACASRRAGEEGIAKLQAFNERVTASVRRGGLSEAMGIVRDGRVGTIDLGSANDVVAMKKQHNHLFGKSGGFLRQMSSLLGLRSAKDPDLPGRDKAAKRPPPSRPRQAGGGGRDSGERGGGEGADARKDKADARKKMTRGMTARLLEAVKSASGANKSKTKKVRDEPR